MTSAASPSDILPIEQLDITDPQEITDWHERFDQYCTAKAIDPPKKINHYLTLIGKQAYRLLKDLAYPTTIATLTVLELQKLLQDHLKPYDYELSEREIFHNLKKSPNETYRAFILRVQQQSAKCNFGAALKEQLRDRLVAGITDQEMKRKLLKEKPSDFAAAKKILRQWDSVNSALSRPTDVMLTQLSTSSTRNNMRAPPRQFHNQHVSLPPRPAWKSTKPSTPRTYPPRSTPHQATNYKPCDSCGGTHLRKDCKFRQAVCRSCNRIGHIQRVCRSSSNNYNNPTAKVKVVNSPQPKADSECEVSVFTLSHHSHLYEDVIFESGQTKKFILDTGSPVSFMPLNTANDLGYRKLQPSTTKIQGVTGNSLKVCLLYTSPSPRDGLLSRMPSSA